MAGKDPAPEPMDDGFVMLEDSSVPQGGRRRDPAGALVDAGGRVDLNTNGSINYWDLVREKGLPKHAVSVKYSVNLAERCVTVHLRPEGTAGSTPVSFNDRNGVNFNILSVFEQYPKLQPTTDMKASVSIGTVKGERVLCLSLKTKEHHSQSRKNNDTSTKKAKTEKPPKSQSPKESQDGGSAAS